MSDGTHDTPKLTADIGERVKATSENGNAYTFSVPAEEKAITEEETADAPTGVANAIDPDVPKGGHIPFTIPVKWTLDTREHWEYIETDEAFRKSTGIVKYSLHKSNSLFFAYELNFYTLEFYKYRFVDETNDEYVKNSIVGGLYSLEYNSEKPTIIFVKGT